MAGAAASAFAELAQIARLVRRKLALRARRVQFAVTRAVWWVGVGAWLLFAFATATIVAVVQLFRGIAGGFATWTGHPWLGDLLAGLAFLGGVAVLLALIAMATRRARLRRLRETLGR